MPVGLAGTFLAAPMAAVMSTADSLLILASAAIVKDLWRNYVVKDDPVKVASYNKNVGKLSTLVTFAFGVIVILLTINPPDIIFFLNLFALGGLEMQLLLASYRRTILEKRNEAGSRQQFNRCRRHLCILLL